MAGTAAGRRPRRVLVGPLLGLGLAGLAAAACDEIDIEQARDCENLVAAFAEPGPFEVVGRESDPSADNAVIIRFRSRGRTEERWISCRFGGEGFELGRRALLGVSTDRDGALSDIQLELLKRFWLAQVAAEPATGAAPPERGPALHLLYFLQQLVNALVVCCVYGLLAVAYTLVYGIIGRINLAFGELATIGAFAALLGVALFAVAAGMVLPLALLAALILAMAVSALYGWITERIVFRPLRNSESQAPLIATIGLAVFLQEYLRLAQGSRDRWLQPVFGEPHLIAAVEGFPVFITTAQVLIVALAAGLYLLHRRAIEPGGFGLAWRACAQDATMAALCGIDVGRTVALSFVLAGAYAAAAGFVVTLYYGGVSFHMGALLGFKALTAAIVGGIGSVPGAFLGGILIGLLETFWSAYLTIAYKDVAIFGVLALILVFRPDGLLGRADPMIR